MLLKSTTAIIAAVSIAAICAVTARTLRETPPPADSADRVISTEGKHAPSFSSWKLDAKLGEALKLSHHGVGSSTPAIKLKPSWFAYIDMAEQAWVYDGEDDLTIYSIIKDKSQVPGTCIYCLCSYKGEIPHEVKSRIKPSAIHHQPQHNQSLQRTPGSGVRSTL